MADEINLSELFPIHAIIQGDRIIIQLHWIISGELPLSLFKNSLRRQLALGQTELDVVVKDKLLFLRIDNSLGRINKQKVAEIAGQMISSLLAATLRNQVTGNKLVYITKSTGIPLIGRNDFGIIDRGTNLIQVRPMTGCLLDCPFCSVDSGSKSRSRITDFIVDPDYLAGEVKKLCEFKGSRGIELHIDGQGEPTLYPYLPSLIKELSAIRGVETMSLQTNGVPLTEKLINELGEVGLSRINLSLNALDQKEAIKLSGNVGYRLAHILQVIRDIKSSGLALLIAPLWIPGLNDNGIVQILRFVKKLGLESNWPILGIQNYLIHRQGRRIKGIKVDSMKHFMWKLQNLEKAYDSFPLLLRPSHFKIVPMASYPKPFTEGEITEVKILGAGRMQGEMLGVGRARALHVLTGTKRVDGTKRVRIIRTKDNIFVGQLIHS